MSQYTQRIIALIKECPGIRLVEIADKIDCDVEVIEPAIGEHVRIGMIIKEDVLAPNGRMQPSFKMASATALKPAVPERTKIDLAMDFLIAHNGKATTQELHEVMALRPGAHVGPYLQESIKQNKIHKRADGAYYLGMSPDDETPEVPLIRRNASTPKPEAIKQAENASAIAQVLANPGAKITSIFESSVVCDGPDTPLISNRAKEFACALWSDGGIEIQRRGQCIAVLQESELIQLVKYFQRVGIC